MSPLVKKTAVITVTVLAIAWLWAFVVPGV
jgi:hypothetical protein